MPEPTVPEPQLTLDGVRAAVADMLGEEPEDLAYDDDLLDAGLDSVRLMALVEQWRSAGRRIAFVDLAERPTVRAWHALLKERG